MVEIKESFGRRIRLARTLKGWTQQDLGVEIFASRQYVHQMESGLKIPSFETLSAMCEALQINESFLRMTVLNELTSEQCHFRKRKTTTLSLSNRVVAFGAIFEDLIDYLKQYIDFPEFDFEGFSESISQLNGDAGYGRKALEEIAEKFRVVNDLSVDAPLDNVTDILEGLGIVVTSFQSVSDKVDALSFSRKHNVILRNTAKESVCRQRFDLAHELGHILLHQGVVTGDGPTEAEADYFASCFLFPRRAFTIEFSSCLTKNGSFRWEEILNLKIRWKVSQRAIIYRSHSLGLINSRQYRSANIHLNTTGQSKVEKLDDILPLEEPTLIQASIKMLEENLDFGFEEIASKIGLESNYLAEMIGVIIKTPCIESNVISIPPRRLNNQ